MVDIMEQGLSGLLSDIPDGFFSNSILEVRLYSTVGEESLVVFTVSDECIIGNWQSDHYLHGITGYSLHAMLQTL